MKSKTCRPLIEVLAQVPDFRKSRGKRHPLSAILALACVAMMCGYRSYSAIAEWGRNYGSELTTALGFTHELTPCAATFHIIFRHLSIKQLEILLSQWVTQVIDATADCQTLDALAIDGKTLRGSQKQNAQITHLLSVVSHRLGLTNFQQSVDVKTNEIPIAIEVLQNLVITGKVITTDALLTQRRICQNIIERGADYVMPVKANQAELKADIQYLFENADSFVNSMTTTRTVDLGHGRLETRRLTASCVLNEFLDWPGIAQVFRIDRRRMELTTGELTEQVVYGVTSLTTDQATAQQLLTFCRQHWHIENQLHWVKDVTFDEDRSQVRCGNIPQVMSALRNTAIGLIRLAGYSNIAQGTRFFAAQPQHALAQIGLHLEN